MGNSQKINEMASYSYRHIVKDLTNSLFDCFPYRQKINDTATQRQKPIVKYLTSQDFSQFLSPDLSTGLATGKVLDLDGIFRRASVFATSEMSHDSDGHKPGRSTETKPL